jgi:hypothetical protein
MHWMRASKRESANATQQPGRMAPERLACTELATCRDPILTATALAGFERHQSVDKERYRECSSLQGLSAELWKERLRACEQPTPPLLPASGVRANGGPARPLPHQLIPRSTSRDPRPVILVPRSSSHDPRPTIPVPRSSSHAPRPALVAPPRPHTTRLCCGRHQSIRAWDHVGETACVGSTDAAGGCGEISPERFAPATVAGQICRSFSCVSIRSAPPLHGGARAPRGSNASSGVPPRRAPHSIG